MKVVNENNILGVRKVYSYQRGYFLLFEAIFRRKTYNTTTKGQQMINTENKKLRNMNSTERHR